MNGRTFSKNPRKLGKRHHHQSKITSKLRCKHSLLMLLKIESLVLLLFLSDAWLGKKRKKMARSLSLPSMGRWHRLWSDYSDLLLRLAPLTSA